jgi:hypothetical protein
MQSSIHPASRALPVLQREATCGYFFMAQRSSNVEPRDYMHPLGQNSDSSGLNVVFPFRSIELRYHIQSSRLNMAAMEELALAREKRKRRLQATPPRTW